MEDSGCSCVSLLCSSHYLVLSWPQAGQRVQPCALSIQTHPASSFPGALLSAGEEESQGLIPLGLVQEKWLPLINRVVCWSVWFPALPTVNMLGRAGELGAQQPMQGSKFHSWRITRATTTRRGLVVEAEACILLFGTYWCQDLWNEWEVLASTALPCQLQFYRWLLSTMSKSWDCNLQVLIVLLHSDQGTMLFLKLKLKEGEATHRWSCGVLWNKEGHYVQSLSAQVCNSTHLCSIHQISSLWINLSPSLAGYTFCFPLVNCKLYLQINIMPRSLLHSDSAVLGLSYQQSVLPRKATLKGGFLKVQLVSEGFTWYWNVIFSRRINFIHKSFNL